MFNCVLCYTPISRHFQPNCLLVLSAKLSTYAQNMHHLKKSSCFLNHQPCDSKIARCRQQTACAAHSFPPTGAMLPGQAQRRVPVSAVPASKAVCWKPQSALFLGPFCMISVPYIVNQRTSACPLSLLSPGPNPNLTSGFSMQPWHSATSQACLAAKSQVINFSSGLCRQASTPLIGLTNLPLLD